MVLLAQDQSAYPVLTHFKQYVVLKMFLFLMWYNNTTLMSVCYTQQILEPLTTGRKWKKC